MTLATLTPEDCTMIQRAARKAAALYVAEYGHRDRAAFSAEVSQEAFCAYASLLRRYATRPTLHGPSCPTHKGPNGRSVDCQHESCLALLHAMPAPLVLAKWAGRDAVRNVTASERTMARPTADVMARLTAEREAMVTPGMQVMGAADRKPQHAFTANLHTASPTTSIIWHRHAGDLSRYPTLADLVETATDSQRGGIAAWRAVARKRGTGTGRALAEIKAQARTEWAALTDKIDTEREALGLVRFDIA